MSSQTPGAAGSSWRQTPEAYTAEVRENDDSDWAHWRRIIPHAVEYAARTCPTDADVNARQAYLLATLNTITTWLHS